MPCADLGQGRYVEGLDAIKELWYGAMGGLPATIQTVLTSPTTARAPPARYIQEHILRANGESGILVAHYDDAYARVDGGLQPHYQGAQEYCRHRFNAQQRRYTHTGVEGVDA